MAGPLYWQVLTPWIQATKMEEVQTHRFNVRKVPILFIMKHINILTIHMNAPRRPSTVKAVLREQYKAVCSIVPNTRKYIVEL